MLVLIGHTIKSINPVASRKIDSIGYVTFAER